MSTWDDLPNDYGHALAVIEDMRAEIDRLQKGLKDRIILLRDAYAKIDRLEKGAAS